MSFRLNVLANYAGQGWRAVMALAFVPAYIRFLGIEAYGLIGLFAVLQAWLVVLDLGMRPALGREMARFSAGALSIEEVRDLLRSVELIFLGLTIAICVAGVLLADWIASTWIGANTLDPAQVGAAVALMIVVIGLRLLENAYVSCLTGLQRQVLENGLTSALATLRAAGAVAILAFVSPTLKAFFVWQATVSLAGIAAYATFVYRTLPQSSRPMQFSRAGLARIKSFSGGVLAISVLALLLTQLDKLLLSRMLPLVSFAHYALASAVAGTLFALTGPVSTAVYPRLSALIAAGSGSEVRRTYHQGAQLVSAIAGSAALFLIAFGEVVLTIWTSDAALAQHVAPLLRVLALGTLLNALMWIPYQAQLAHGWTRLTLYTNSVAAIVLVPAILIVVPRFGALGAAWIWVALNIGYLVFSIHFMHRRILPETKWRWYLNDVLAPLAGSAIVSLLLYCVLDLQALTSATSRNLLTLIAAAIMIAAAGIACADLLRHQLIDKLKARF